MGGSSSKPHASNDFELVIVASKELEHLLEFHFGAVQAPGGSPIGLQEKITIAAASSGGAISPQLQKRMRYLATLRNKLVHDRSYNALDDRPGFIRAYDESVAELGAIIKARSGGAATASHCIIM